MKTVQNHSKLTRSHDQWSTKTVQNHSKSIKSIEQWSTKTIQSHSKSSGSLGKFPKLLAEKPINTDMEGVNRILIDTLDGELANHISQNEPVSCCSVWAFFTPAARFTLTDNQTFFELRLRRFCLDRCVATANITFPKIERSGFNSGQCILFFRASGAFCA